MKTNLGEFLAEVDQHLLLRAFLHGHQLTAVDVVVISNIRSTEDSKLPVHVTKWCSDCETLIGVVKAEMVNRMTSKKKGKIKDKKKAIQGSIELIRAV